MVSEFNLENLTEYSNDANAIDDSLVDSENDQVKIDYNLYCKFWALQDFFRNPNQCYNTVQWKTFAMVGPLILTLHRIVHVKLSFSYFPPARIECFVCIQQLQTGGTTGQFVEKQ